MKIKRQIFGIYPEIKKAKTVTEAMLLAEAEGLSHDQIGKIFVEKVKQLRK
jgi:chromosome segregation and condensation protein ScpB